MKTEYIGPFVVPDGYNGNNTIIHLCFDQESKCCIEVCKTGFFKSCIPPANTKEEVEWLIKNHPVCKHRFSIR